MEAFSGQPKQDWGGGLRLAGSSLVGEPLKKKVGNSLSRPKVPELGDALASSVFQSVQLPSRKGARKVLWGAVQSLHRRVDRVHNAVRPNETTTVSSGCHTRILVCARA